jgi:hypothetical protein
VALQAVPAGPELFFRSKMKQNNRASFVLVYQNLLNKHFKKGVIR